MYFFRVFLFFIWSHNYFDESSAIESFFMTVFNTLILRYFTGFVYVCVFAVVRLISHFFSFYIYYLRRNGLGILFSVAHLVISSLDHSKNYQLLLIWTKKNFFRFICLLLSFYSVFFLCVFAWKNKLLPFIQLENLDVLACTKKWSKITQTLSQSIHIII